MKFETSMLEQLQKAIKEYEDGLKTWRMQCRTNKILNEKVTTLMEENGLECCAIKPN